MSQRICRTIRCLYVDVSMDLLPVGVAAAGFSSPKGAVHGRTDLESVSVNA